MTSYSAAEIAAVLQAPEPTDEQVAVVQAPAEPLLVVAGAGSGKTETMAARVVWLVANGLVTPDQVLGLTFTRKAAGELADRVRSRLGRLSRSGLGVPASEGEPTVSTYHAYAASLVADHGLRLGVEPRSRLLGEAAAWQLATEVVEAWDDPAMADMTFRPSTVVDAVVALAAECAEHLVTPDELAAHLDEVVERLASLPAPVRPGTRDLLALTRRRRLVVPLVRRYLERKREREQLDFGDQVALAARVASAVASVGAGERGRFAVVLLDEYQDTSHAQVVLLRALYGGGHPVTAVGDPHQSIYGWRGASAGNLQSFPEHFPRSDGATAAVAYLRTSWRNDDTVLATANVVAGPLRSATKVEVPPLVSRPSSGPGEVVARWHATVEDEAAAVADDLAERWAEDDVVVASGGARRSMAVLCRKRSQFEPVERALRARGLPVEVVGLGGLLSRPEVVDLVATLHVVHDPSRGDALVRLLTGPRWRVGPRDLETLGEWAKALLARHRAVSGPASGVGDPEAADPDVVDERSIVDALDLLPPPGWEGRHGRGFSVPGRARLERLAGLLRRCRGRAALSLPDLVVEVERELLLDIEVGARPGVAASTARSALDAFTDVASTFAETADLATLGAFLAWLEAADKRERGLEGGDDVEDTSLAPGDVEPSRRAVQVLTVHAAKGLEWDVVAVPGLVEGTFPAKPGRGWLTGLGMLPYDLRGDRSALPALHWRDASTQDDLGVALERFTGDCSDHGVNEERRLAYVAVTRSRSRLLLSGSWWGDGKRPRAPSRFLVELAVDPQPGVVVTGLDPAEIAAGPSETANPRLAEPRSALWPVDPLGPRRAVVETAASAVLAAGAAASAVQAAEALPTGGAWSWEVDRLLAERDAAGAESPLRVVLPSHLSASRMVELARDPIALAERIRRPMPEEPRPRTRRGTAFHAWLERRFRAGALVDVLDLPGAGDDDAAPDAELARLQAVFLASEWADRTPVAVEVDVETPVSGVVLRGRVDAVFTRAGGGVEVVDWKTGPPPTGERRRLAAVQLAVYRLAWARLHSLALDDVGAAFFYASTGETVRIADALDAAGLEALVLGVPRS